MTWYYAVGGQQQGPVDDAQLDALFTAGTINADTLVWHEGMANWQPLREARPTTATTAPPVVGVAPPIAGGPATGEVVCVECGKIFTKDNAIQYGTAWVCATCKPVFVQKLQEGAAVPQMLGQATAMHYGGFWIRFAAKFIDGLILFAVIGIPAMVFGGFIGYQAARGGGAQSPLTAINLGFQMLIWVLDLGLRLAYNTFFVGKYGATPGKMACGLKVVTPEGASVSYGRALGRAASEIVSGMICLIGYIIAGFDNEKRALHDHMCNTRVVYK